MSNTDHLHAEEYADIPESDVEAENHAGNQSLGQAGSDVGTVKEVTPAVCEATEGSGEATRVIRPNKAVADVFAVTERTMGPLCKAMRPLEQVTRAARRMMPRSELTRILGRLYAGAQRIHALPPRVTAALLAIGFPPPFLATISMGDLNRFAEVYEQHGTAAARSEIETLCSEVLTDTQLREERLARWENNPYAASCIDVLRDVVSAHLAGLYYASIPAALAQLEGYIVRRFGHTGWLKGAKLDDFVAALEKEDDGLFGGVFADIMRTVRENFVHGDVIPPLSRHAVLHGADTTYGTKFNSLLVIALFDYVQELLSDDDDLGVVRP